MNTGEDQPRNPYLTVDGLLYRSGELIAIKRSNPPHGYALPGGFVEYGETCEQAVEREIKEETDLGFESPELFNVYSDPDRDPRHHTVTICYWGSYEGTAGAGSDAEEVIAFPLTGDWPRLVFDHTRIVHDFKQFVKQNEFPNRGAIS